MSHRAAHVDTDNAMSCGVWGGGLYRAEKYRRNGHKINLFENQAQFNSTPSASGAWAPASAAAFIKTAMTCSRIVVTATVAATTDLGSAPSGARISTQQTPKDADQQGEINI